MTSRPLQETDLGTLQTALDNNMFHPGQHASQFVGEGKFSEVYEDDKGMVGFLRYTKSLRLVVTWIDPNDKRRNAESIIAAIKNTVERAKAAGFTDIIFESKVDAVKNFCKQLGFRASDGETMVLNVG